MVKLQDSRYPPARTGALRGARLSCIAAAAITLTACQTVPVAPTLTIPQSLRAPCVKPTGYDQVTTIGQLAAYSLAQDGALSECEAKRAAIVDLVEIKPKRKKVWGVF